MVSKTWLMNVVLALVAAFFCLKAYGVWFQGNKGIEIPEVSRNPVPSVAKTLEVFDKVKITPETEYNVLMSLNLFSPERTEILPDTTKPDVETETVSAAQQKTLEQSIKKITLYGMVITENSAEALISDIVVVPAPGQRRPLGRKKNTVKQTKWVKVGDTLGEFKVAEIKPDGIRLKAGATTFDVLLYDEERIKKRTPVQPKEGPRVVGLSEEKPGIGGETKKGPPTIPVSETATSPKTGSPPPPDQPEKKSASAQLGTSAPSGAADNLEKYLRQTGDKKPIDAYNSQKR